jgi:predicted nucleotide-binding protein
MLGQVMDEQSLLTWFQQIDERISQVFIRGTHQYALRAAVLTEMQTALESVFPPSHAVRKRWEDARSRECQALQRDFAGALDFVQDELVEIFRVSYSLLKEGRYQRKTEENFGQRENVFIIHGRDEAKWRELKDIIKSKFGLNPVVLLEQPDIGATTVIEKFEHYALTCGYAIAVFTPDDEVKSGGETYLQARPNVIYELGWFCARLGRSRVMLLLKEGTSIFSDFGGIIQKRFAQNVSERILEIKEDLVAAGVFDETSA